MLLFVLLILCQLVLLTVGSLSDALSIGEYNFVLQKPPRPTNITFSLFKNSASYYSLIDARDKNATSMAASTQVLQT